MRDVNEVTQGVLAGAEVHDILMDVSERARSLVSGSAAWVVVPDESNPDRLRVTAAAGRAGDQLLGAFRTRRRACLPVRCWPANRSCWST